LSSRIELEVNNEEIYKIMRSDGLSAGKAFMNFVIFYSNWRNNYSDSPLVSDWFTKLESLLNADLILLDDIAYSGSYFKEQVERFVLSKEDSDFNDKEKYFEWKSKIDEMWTPIDSLIILVQELIKIFPELGNETEWYSPIDTILDFEALLDTLHLAKDRGGTEARIIAD